MAQDKQGLYYRYSHTRNMTISLSLLEEKINYKFKNKDLLREALTHKSYINEKPSWDLPHNERLEFLGDAVLELVTTEELFKRYPDFPEGKLTPIRSALVNYQMLAEVGKDIGLEKYIFMSRGESKDRGRARDVILANAMEAVIGSLYLDGHYKPVKDFINKFVMCKLENVMKNELYKDSKSLLQEIIQEKLRLTPTYKVLSESGPDHKKKFVIGVYFGDKIIAKGTGFSKQEAEVDAAKSALEQSE